MTRIDFYVLESPSAQRHQRLVYRLVDKAWRSGNLVHVHCATADEASACDDLLWTCFDTGFIPHGLVGDAEIGAVPVTIGMPADVPSATDVLVNLDAGVPEFFSRFERVMETTGYDDAQRARARERYKFYQARGYAIETHKIQLN